MRQYIYVMAATLGLFVGPRGRAADIVEGDTGRALDGILSKYAQEGFCGAMLFAKDGKVLFCKGYGYANRAEKRPFTPQTVFDIGSVTNQFTATCTLRPARDGKLPLLDPITLYLSNHPQRKKRI